MSFTSFIHKIKKHFAEGPDKQSQAKATQNAQTSRSEFFHTKPLILKNGYKLPKHRIPLIPTSSNKLFNRLYHYQLEYTILNNHCLLIQNYDPKAYQKFIDDGSQANRDALSQIRPLHTTDRQFIKWLRTMHDNGFVPIGASYATKHGPKTDYASKQYPILDPQQINRYEKSHVRFYFILFQNRRTPHNRLAINLDGSIYNLSRSAVPNYQNTTAFVKALIKHEVQGE